MYSIEGELVRVRYLKKEFQGKSEAHATAEKDLRTFFRTSSSFSVRYEAARALGMDKNSAAELVKECYMDELTERVAEAYDNPALMSPLLRDLVVLHELTKMPEFPVPEIEV